MKNIVKKIKKTIFRNEYSIGEQKSRHKQINLEWWSDKVNLGDYLAIVIYKWMLEQKKLELEKKVQHTVHLSTVGSIIGMGKYDSVIWGSGIHSLDTLTSIWKNRKNIKYDIRIVRGPVTKQILEYCGYKVPEDLYGDPAILMPKIYSGNYSSKKYKYTLIPHITNKNIEVSGECNILSIQTNDYKKFIDTILESECIISSSLHGIILAEAYGVPAIFLNENMDKQLMKYYDWYYSTGRKTVKIANSLKEAMDMEPMELPDLEKMRENLLKTFPYELWK